MHARCLLVLPFFAWTALCAQTQEQTGTESSPRAVEQLQKEERPDPRRNQKIERIRIEDAGSRIDELRYGGQTQSITVQPKANMPEYEFQPTDLSRSRPADNRDGMSSPASQRVWNVMKF